MPLPKNVEKVFEEHADDPAKFWKKRDSKFKSKEDAANQRFHDAADLSATASKNLKLDVLSVSAKLEILKHNILNKTSNNSKQCQRQHMDLIRDLFNY